MILDRITLHNFGLYRDYQEIDLAPPSPDKPIVLFGGLNGGGKTTLLDAIQLALYGKLAKCSNRNGMAYGEYLRHCIHKGNNAQEAALILEFRHTTEGQVNSYRIQRKWNGKARNVTDQVIVFRNGVEDSQLAERWLEFVEEMLPSNIAHLFFFDGEKIEAFADPTQSADLLQAAMRSLLGLDLVDRLSADLLALERRHKEKALGAQERVRVEELRAELKVQHDTNADLNLELGTANTEIDEAQKRLQTLEHTFEKEGGTLFEKRQELEAKLAHVKGTLEQTQHELVSLGGDPKTPLMLVSGMLRQLEEQHQAEQSQHDNSLLVELLQERDQWMLDTLEQIGLGQKKATTLAEMLTQDRQKRVEASKTPSFLHLSPEASALLRSVLPPQADELRQRLNDKLARSLQLQEDLVQQERLLGAVPESDHIHQMIQEREALKQKLQSLRQKRARIQGELESGQGVIERLEGEYNRLLEKVARAELGRLEAQRLLDHAQKSRGTLTRFRESVLKHNIRRIETIILESFKALMRKDNFIHDLRISPDKFELQLIGTSNNPIEATRLSAGERQLLAVSMLWGLARASGRTLPIVIDTPLGRLDSKHRTNLIDRYFPKASQQVLLLSTDEEIDATYYKQLKSAVGRTYHLEYNHDKGCTQVSPGYFWNEQLAS